MPKRKDLDSVLIIGSGPIVIGQACEFDYSGTQACKALREEGIRVVLINSNPATIMTDPETADATYVEPLTVEILDKILEKEKPKAILPTLGGQTALNLALRAHESGILKKHGVELIGASVDAIDKAEDRERFKSAMTKIGLRTAKSFNVSSLQEARDCVPEIGFPAILRPSFTMGGAGAAIAYNSREFDHLVQRALDLSPVTQLLIEESVLGWKEYELEVMRDHKDNVVIICSIENFDPMGIHTGDSLTVAPAMTLTDREYQKMRTDSLAIIREIGVDTGGSNIQFAVNPENGDQIVIEMNPRVSRSSALASKATGFPIAKIAAKLALGYSLDELSNDITKVTPASFEPSIDYVVVKMPRFTFEKFPQAKAILGTQMKSVGEAMAIGRTFREALGKAIRSLETGRHGFDLKLPDDLGELSRLIAHPGPLRLFHIAKAFQMGMPVERARQLTQIDPWFLTQLRTLAQHENWVAAQGSLPKVLPRLRELKASGLSDHRIASLLDCSEKEVRSLRHEHNIVPVYKRVDTCAAEFASHTPYLYSTYEQECEAEPTTRKKVIILGGGPNRIGQGIEFDYCCVHASYALAEEDVESIMVNCNPETVSTDYDTSDRLYFEPLSLEDVLEICRKEKPFGVIVQFGGQTPLKLAKALEAEGINLLGTSAEAIDRAEDRERFGAVMEKLNLKSPKWSIAHSVEDAFQVAEDLGYPLMVRPSYVLGGRGMECVHDSNAMRAYIDEVLGAFEDHSVALPLLIDQFLGDAIELDVDVLADKTGAVVVGGILEHIEEAGIHSGDSACSLPPYSLSPEMIEKIRAQATALARELKVVGLMNAQFAIYEGEVYIIEVNPRASRTVPFVSKSIGVPLARVAVKLMLGRTLKELNIKEVVPTHFAVKESIFPFIKFEDVDVILGPEMRSTGEVMGIDQTFAMAFAKSQLAASTTLPQGGKAFLSVRNRDKEQLVDYAEKLVQQGFTITATHGTALFLRENGVEASGINKVMEGRPHCVDAIESNVFDFIVNTTEGRQAIIDSRSLRRAALLTGTTYYTTMRAAWAALEAIRLQSQGTMDVHSIQSYHPSN